MEPEGFSWTRGPSAQGGVYCYFLYVQPAETLGCAITLNSSLPRCVFYMKQKRRDGLQSADGGINT